MSPFTVRMYVISEAKRHKADMTRAVGTIAYVSHAIVPIATARSGNAILWHGKYFREYNIKGHAALGARKA